MSVINLIAKRYLFAHKEKTIVNIISWISLAGIAISTIALVVVLSVYNGIGLLTQSLFNVFDPELSIEPSTGKTFHTSDIDYTSLCSLDGIRTVSPIVEENAWITLRQSGSIVLLRGVDDSYAASCGIDTLVQQGSFILHDGDANYLVIGWNIMMQLGVNSSTNIPLAVHIPKRGTQSLGFTIDDAFNNGYAYAAGTFQIQDEIDNQYVLTNIDFVRQLMNYTDDEVTSLSITVDNGKDVARIKKIIAAQLGPSYTVKDRMDQKPLYYKIFRSERLGVFLILSLIVLIATLNLVASLSLLIINKRKDISTLRALGMQRNNIRRIFFVEGLLIAVVGIVAGLVLGFFICLLQQQFGIVKLGANAVVDAFPVAMRVVDFASTALVVALLSSIVVALTVRRAKI